MCKEFHSVQETAQNLFAIYHELRHLRQDIMKEYSTWTEENKLYSNFEEEYNSDSEIDARKAEILSHTHEYSRLTVFDGDLSFYQS